SRTPLDRAIKSTSLEPSTSTPIGSASFPNRSNRSSIIPSSLQSRRPCATSGRRTKEERNTMKAVVMAGGEGSRLRPLTSRRPKPLAPIANKPVMHHIVDLLAQHGITEVVATLHYLADEIETYF